MLALSSCSVGYQSIQVEDVSYNDLFELTAFMVGRAGFVIDVSDRNSGEIVSKWDYNKLIDVGRFPIRRRLTAQIDPEGENNLSLEIRTYQEALWESYNMTTDQDKRKGWQAYGFDKQTAHDILTIIKTQITEFEFSDEYYNRHKRLEEIMESVPEVLDEEEE